MVATPDNNSGRIRVADITLAQLSRGLYRSNATVFKELINNAYDAEATEVRVNTNYPSFDYISIVDNGSGMSREAFHSHFADNGIGSSTKRRDNQNVTGKFKRPIIGRLGIGMMAIGQLCHSFEVESHYYDKKGNGLAFRGEIILTNLDTPDVVAQSNRPLGSKKEVDVGTWSYEAIEFNPEKVGFRIYSSDVRGTFRREMSESYETEAEFRNVPFSISKILEIFYQHNNKSIRDCKAYLETIWELCTLCPLPYLDNARSPLKWKKNKNVDILDARFDKFIQARQKSLLDYKFSVQFDGVSLNKLIQLPTIEQLSCKVYFFEYDEMVFDTKLKFSGYIFSQISRHIRPLELNGIQVRLRNVGIGGYDSTFLKYYKQVETIRSKWISGEIFVDEGLEAALNIDRDSFNEHEEHYKMLQKQMHIILDKVFEETSKAADAKRKIEVNHKLHAQSDRIKDYLLEVTDGAYRIMEDSSISEPMIIDHKKGLIRINNNIKILKKTKADQLYKIIDIAYHVTRNTPSADQRHDVFMDLMKKVLKDLI